MNDFNLKLEMARLIHNKIRYDEEKDDAGLIAYRGFSWIESGDEVRESEWLYIMQLAERELGQDWITYCHKLYAVIQDDNPAFCGDFGSVRFDALKAYRCLGATFNQRATAMCSVKEISLEPPSLPHHKSVSEISGSAALSRQA